MGRAKLKIEFIVNKKARAQNFKRRKQGLIKKLQELVTLCGVEGCIFVHTPDADLQRPDDAIWPPADPGAIRRMIDLYRAKKTDSDSGTRGVSDFDLGAKKNSVDFCDQGQSPAVDLSSGLLPMPMAMIQYSDFTHPLLMPLPDQQDYMASYCYSIDPLWMMDPVLRSQDWAAGDSHEFGYTPAQFFLPYGIDTA